MQPFRIQSHTARVNTNLDSVGGVIEEEEEKKKERRLQGEIEGGTKRVRNGEDYVDKVKVDWVDWVGRDDAVRDMHP